MLKKITTALLCTVYGNLAYADISTSERFIGVEIASSEVQGEQPSSTSDGLSFGIRVGAQNEEWRTTIGFSLYDKDEYSVEKLFLSVDYLFLKYGEFNNFSIQPYVGMNVGYANYEQGAIDENGLLYGGQAGIIVNVMELIDVDLAYRYSLSSADALDHTSDLLLGLHYHF